MNQSMPLLLLLLKTLAVFAVSGLVLLVFRRASASARHLVCLLTLGALLALPLFSLTLPGWRLPVLQSGATKQEPMLQEPTPQQVATLPRGEGKELNPIPASTSYSSSSLAGRTPVSEASKEVGFWPVALLALYTLGALLAALRPLLGLRGIGHLRRICVPVTDAPTLALSADCAAVLCLSRPVLLCVADVPVPMTWGWRRPVVLLPTEFLAWPADRTQAVLLHEMAHVKRRDWLSHRLADLVCAVYWFHPLAWLTARRLRAEGEIACDDLVLASGIAAPDYALHLLDIARALSSPSQPPQSAIAMAQTSQIAGRLTMILDKTQSRRTLTRRILMAAFAFGTAALVPLAMLKPTAKAQATPLSNAALPGVDVQIPERGLHLTFSSMAAARAAGGGMTFVTSPDLKVNGTTLFAGVTDANKPGGKWWSASGVPLPNPVFDTEEAYQHIISSHSPGQRSLTFAFRLPAAAQDVTVQYKVPQSTYSSDGVWPGKSASDAGSTESQIFASTGGVRVMSASLPPNLKKTHLSVGIASGTWEMATHETENPNAVEPFGDTSAAAYGSIFILSSPVATATGLVLIVSTNSTRDIRVIAIDKQGNKVFPTNVGGESANSLTQITAHFSQPIAQFKEFLVETRPFQWVEFKDVALHPAQ